MTDGNPGCVHHWQIDIADGPRSNGVCQKCGATREFQNHFADGDWRAASRAGYGARPDGAATLEV